MKTKAGLRLLAMSSALLLGALWLCLIPHEPSYQGKRLSVWLQDLDLESPEREAAVRNLGEKCVPKLLEMLRCKDSRLMEKLLDLADRHKSIGKTLELLKISSAESRRRVAVDAFRVLGSAAKPAIPELIKMLGLDFDQPETRSYNYDAATALGWIGSEATLPLLDLFSATNVVLRVGAAYALGEGGPSSAVAVPTLLKSLDDQNANVRAAVAAALGEIRRQPKDVVPALISKLEDQGPRVGANCATALSRFGADGRSAVPALLRCLKLLIDDRAAQQAAALALVELHQEGDMIVPALIENLESSHGSVREHSVIALGRLGIEAQAALPALGKLSNDLTEIGNGCVVMSVRFVAKDAIRRIQNGARPMRMFGKPDGGAPTKPL